MSDICRILIIDGGGIYGCIPSTLLSFIPLKYSLNNVDVLSGCSVGGILALAYCTGQSFSLVNCHFLANVDKCFTKRLPAYFNPLTTPTYDTEAIDLVLQLILGDMKLGEIRNKFPALDVVIPTLNITDDNYKVFDNIKHDDDLISLKLLAGMTSAAPTYFDCREYQGKCYVDGGLILVSPILTTISAIKDKRGIPFENMRVLVIGTGKDVDLKPITVDRYRSLGLLGIAKEIIVPYTTFGNWLSSDFWAKQILGLRMVHYNPLTITGNLAATDLVPLLVEETKKHKDLFLAVWLEFMK